MSILELLKLAFGALSVLFGVVALLRPQMLATAAGLDASSEQGTAEIRSSWGGMFIGLGAAILFLQSRDAYLVVGLAYGLTAVVRMMTISMNRSILNPVVINILVFEIAAAVILLLPLGPAE